MSKAISGAPISRSKLTAADETGLSAYYQGVSSVQTVLSVENPPAMSAVPGQFGQPPPAASAWQEYRSADGRVYYYNAMTKVTQWTKPEDMMSPVEVRQVLEG